jgi:hypothetical protein
MICSGSSGLAASTLAGSGGVSSPLTSSGALVRSAAERVEQLAVVSLGHLMGAGVAPPNTSVVTLTPTLLNLKSNLIRL